MIQVSNMIRRANYFLNPGWSEVHSRFEPSTNSPFKSCACSDLAFEWKRVEFVLIQTYKPLGDVAFYHSFDILGANNREKQQKQ